MLHYKYKDNNKEDTLVVLHGLGGNNGCFLKQYKLFNKYFNLLFIDLPSHGKSKETKLSQKLIVSFKSIGDDIIDVLDYLNIEQSHFVGLSLGTMVIHDIVVSHANRVKSIIQIGSVMKYNLISGAFMNAMLSLKKMFSCETLYKTLVYSLMPTKNQKEARKFFIKSALSSLDKIELIAWLKIVANFSKTYTFDKLKNNSIPKLYIMGEGDYVLIKSVIKYTKEDIHSKLMLIKNAGHVCNIDNADELNDKLETYFTNLIVAN